LNVYKNGCVKKPSNAHCVESTSDAWLCNTGYKEVGNSCVVSKEEAKSVYKSNSASPKKVSSPAYNYSDSGDSESYGWLWTLLTLGGLYGLGKYLGKNK
jgi:hypothetical protein